MLLPMLSSLQSPQAIRRRLSTQLMFTLFRLTLAPLLSSAACAPLFSTATREREKERVTFCLSLPAAHSLESDSLTGASCRSTLSLRVLLTFPPDSHPFSHATPTLIHTHQASIASSSHPHFALHSDQIPLQTLSSRMWISDLSRECVRGKRERESRETRDARETRVTLAIKSRCCRAQRLLRSASTASSSS